MKETHTTVFTSIFSDMSSPLPCVLTDYLTWEDLARLDSAIVERNLRKMFLLSISFWAFRDRHKIKPLQSLQQFNIRENTFAELKWRLCRKICFNSVSFRGSVKREWTHDTYSNAVQLLMENDYGLLQQITCIDTDYLNDSVALLQACPNLHTLNVGSVEGSYQITEESMAIIAACCKRLKTLSLFGCMILTDQSICRLVEDCRELHQLDLSCCISLSDAALKALAENCHNLQDLVLMGCCGVNDESLISLGDGCKQLSQLNLLGCKNVTDLGLMSLSNGCRHLRSLNLADCENITDLSITSLATKCKELRTLNLRKCRGITDKSLYTLMSGGCNKSIRYLNVRGEFICVVFVSWILKFYTSV